MTDSIKFEHEERGGDFLGHIDYPNDGTGPFAYLESIYVYPGRRNEGSGKYLIQKFEEICLMLGAKSIEGMFLPHTDCDPKTVERFYNRNGYEVTGRLSDGHRYISKNLDIKRLPAGEIIKQPNQVEVQVSQEISYSEI